MALIKNITVEEVRQLFRLQTSKQFANKQLAQKGLSIHLNDTPEKILDLESVLVSSIHKQILNGKALNTVALRYYTTLHKIITLMENEGDAWRNIITRYEFSVLNLNMKFNRIRSEVSNYKVAPYHSDKPHDIEDRKKVLEVERQKLISETADKLEEIATCFEEFKQLFLKLEEISLTTT
ncbi:MAG: hypothetical protein ACI9TY_000323 [Alphaproteobacteria bacterium]|jgi:hypothetical protein